MKRCVIEKTLLSLPSDPLCFFSLLPPPHLWWQSFSDSVGFASTHETRRRNLIHAPRYTSRSPVENVSANICMKHRLWEICRHKLQIWATQCFLCLVLFLFSTDAVLFWAPWNTFSPACSPPLISGLWASRAFLSGEWLICHSFSG